MGQIGEQKAKDSLPVEIHLKVKKQIPLIVAAVEIFTKLHVTDISTLVSA